MHRGIVNLTAEEEQYLIQLIENDSPLKQKLLLPASSPIRDIQITGEDANTVLDLLPPPSAGEPVVTNLRNKFNAFLSGT